MAKIKIRNLINEGWIEFDQFDEGRVLTAGSYLAGGGDLSANRRFDVDHSVLGSLLAGTFYTETEVDTIIAAVAASGVPESRTLTAGSYLSGGGNLTTDRRFDVDHSVLGALLAGTFYTETEVDTFMALAASKSLALAAGSYLSGGGDLSANRRFDVEHSALGSLLAGTFYTETEVDTIIAALDELPNVAAAGYALVSDGENSWAADQTPTWTGKHTFHTDMDITLVNTEDVYCTLNRTTSYASDSGTFAAHEIVVTNPSDGKVMGLYMRSSDTTSGGGIWGISVDIDPQVDRAGADPRYDRTAYMAINVGSYKCTDAFYVGGTEGWEYALGIDGPVDYIIRCVGETIGRGIDIHEATITNDEALWVPYAKGVKWGTDGTSIWGTAGVITVRPTTTEVAYFKATEVELKQVCTMIDEGFRGKWAAQAGWPAVEDFATGEYKMVWDTDTGAQRLYVKTDTSLWYVAMTQQA